MFDRLTGSLRRYVHLPVLLCLVLGCAASIARAHEWDGNGGSPPSGYFHDPWMWNPNTVPGSSDDAVFDLDAMYSVYFSDDASTANLDVRQGTINFESTGGTERTYEATGEFFVGNAFLKLNDIYLQVIDNARIGYGSDASGWARVEVADDALLVNGAHVSLGWSQDYNGTVEVSGTGEWILAEGWHVGGIGGGMGTVHIESGGTVGSGLITPTRAYLGGMAATGYVLIEGTDSSWTHRGSVYVGGEYWNGGHQSGDGTLVILDGGRMELVGGWMEAGFGTSGTGDIYVQNDGSELVLDGGLQVGYSGTGYLLIADGGYVQSAQLATIASLTGSTGEVTVDGADSLWDTGELWVGGRDLGAGGAGTLNVTDFGTVQVDGDMTIWPSGSLYLEEGLVTADSFHREGAATLYTGILSELRVNSLSGVPAVNGSLTIGHSGGSGSGSHVVGAGQTLAVPSGFLTIGLDAPGSLAIQSGGQVLAHLLFVGTEEGGDGVVEIDGATSGLFVTGSIAIGTTTPSTGSGRLTLLDGSVDVPTGSVWIDTDGVLEMHGGLLWADAIYITDGELIGSGGVIRTNELTYVPSSVDFDGGLELGHLSGSGGGLTTTIDNGPFRAGDHIYVGEQAPATLVVASDWGYLYTDDLRIRAQGQVDLDAFAWIMADKFYIDTAGGGVFNSQLHSVIVVNSFNPTELIPLVGGHLEIGHNGGTANYTIGAGQSWNLPQDFTVARDATATVRVEAGGQLSNEYGYVGRYMGSVGQVTVTGTGSRWHSQGSLSIGDYGVEDSATVTAAYDGVVEADTDIYVYPSGRLELNEGLVQAAEVEVIGGRLVGTGTVEANVINSGVIAPGLSTGTLTVDGEFTQYSTGTLEIEVAKPTEHDQLAIIGYTPTLGGTLDVTVVGPASGHPYVFTYGDRMEILTVARRYNGTFAAHLLPELGGGLSFDVTYEETVVALVVGGLPGDYNYNGVVDAADYTVWRDSLGQTGTLLAADGDRDGEVTESDYTYWKVRFGNTAGSGAGSLAVMPAVPEPAGIVLVGLGLLWAAAFRSPRLRRLDTQISDQEESPCSHEV